MFYGAVKAYHPSFKRKESSVETRIGKEILGVESDALFGLFGEKADRAKKLDRAEEHHPQGFNTQDFART